MTYVNRVCEKCHKEFTVLKKHTHNGRGRFCGRSCSVSFCNTARKGTYSCRPRFGCENPAWKGGISADKVRYTNRFREKFPEKVHAHKVVRRALKLGILVRQPCAHCGSTDRIHGHHTDYKKPLQVIWLCKPCHIQEHVRLSREAA